MKRLYSRLALAAALFTSSGIINAQTTFNYTGSVQTYTVPGCINSITIDAQGAAGGHAEYSRGGWGGRVQCTMAVTPGQVLDIYVGGKGDTAVVTGPTAGGSGGYNGGGNGSVKPGQYAGSGAGGASDIRMAPYGLADRILVASGGAGAGFDFSTIDYDRGGDGGGTTGENGAHDGTIGDPKAGTGGTPTAGGIGGVYPSYTSGAPGVLGIGGDGGAGTAGGGGGGGYYGGGGGSWGGGGGGSSYASATLASAVTHTIGYNTSGNGSVIINGCNPIGTITATSFSVCQGSTIPVNNPTSVSCGFWSSSNTAIATIGSSTAIITGVAAGTATITYNIPAPCGGTSAVQTITVNATPAPVTGPSTVCVANTITVSDATGFGGWISSNPAVATVGISSGVVTGVSLGTAVIDYTLLTGCMSSMTVTVSCGVGVPQTTSPDKYKVDIFPNPTSNELTIKTEDGAYSSFTITNTLGQLVMQQEIKTKQTTVSVKNLPAAVYYITCRGAYGTTTQRFVKTE